MTFDDIVLQLLSFRHRSLGKGVSSGEIDAASAALGVPIQPDRAPTAYDGDEQRIRKTTPKEETLYFEGMYERVTAMGAPTEHRYYVRSPERVVAIVTRGGAQPGTRYVHVDQARLR